MKLSNYVQTNKWKLIKTFFCYLTYFTIGGCGTLLGSSLLDLQIRLNVSFKQLSSLAPSQSIGFFIGGLIYLNTCILSTWDHEVSVYVQLLHGSFGLGSLLAPLIVKPFLLPLAQNETETQSDEVILGDYTPDDVRIQYPYLILGSILVFSSFGFLFFHFKKESVQNKNSSTDVEIVDDDHPVWKKILAVFIVACIAHTTFGVDLITGTLAPAFVVKSDLRMTKQAGANLVSGFWFCVTFCRVLFIVLIKFINERRVIIFNCTLSIIGLILMCIFPTHSQVITWISFILLAIGISPTFSSSLGLLQKYITVSDRYASFLFIFGAAGEAAHPWIVSKFMASLPKLFAYYIAVLSCISVVSVLSLPPICQKLFKFETKTTLNRLAPVK